jgi:hypothetical protein
MSNPHPDNGPSFSKAPPKGRQFRPPPSADRIQGELDEAARDCADTRLFIKSPLAWFKKHGVIKGE